MMRVHRIAPHYLRTVIRREWQLALLAVVGLAPGVAALLAWLNIAVHVREQAVLRLLSGWLLPPWLLATLGVSGVLTGAGMVTLLIGCLGLTNAYLASLERRAPELALLQSLGLSYRHLLLLLSLEALAAGLLGSGVGLLFGWGLSRLAWPAAAAYFGLVGAHTLTATALWAAFCAGVGAALLFMHTAVRLTQPRNVDPARARQSMIYAVQQNNRSALAGALYAGLLTWGVGFLILPPVAALTLGALAEFLAVLLTLGGWLLTWLYQRLPRATRWPLWSLAIQGLAHHPNQTAGMTLALTTGSYAVGMAALSWLASDGQAHFPFWVAGLVLVAGATLVFTVAALAAWERRKTVGMLLALGAHRRHAGQLILLEYTIVALGGGTLGTLMAFATWLMAGPPDHRWAALGLILVDLVGALLSAWIGAAPVLWLVTRRPIGQSVR